MKIAIVDNDIEHLNFIRLQVERAHVAECECEGFTNPETLLMKIERGVGYEVYLLDIELPEISGLELAKKIRKLQKNAYIVFLTSYPQYALDSYDVEIQAYQYLLKMDMEKKLPKILRGIAEELTNRKEDYYIIQSKQHFDKIMISDISYLRKDGKYTLIVTGDGEHRERKTIREILKEIGKPEFVSIDAGNAVNIQYIRSLEKDQIILDSGKVFYVSHVTMKRLRNKVKEYWRWNLG